MLRTILPPLAILLVAWTGRRITAENMDWYAGLALPPWTPSGQVIGAVWTALFFLAALAVIIWFRRVPEEMKPYGGIGLLSLNGLLNVGWTWLFFGNQLIGPAVLAAALLAFSALSVIIAFWPTSKAAALLFVPYLAWVSFAAYLNYAVWVLNR